MIYTEWKIEGKEALKLRLTSKGCVSAERRVGTNPMNMLMSMENDKLPPLEAILIILHEALQPLEHGYDMEDLYDLYDEYIAGGGTMLDLIPVVLDVFKVSGFFKEGKGKNAKGAKK